MLNACQDFDVQKIPCPASATATVSGLLPGAVYHYEVFQYNEKLLGSPSSMYVENALAVNGEDFGHTVAFDSDAATAIGDATATVAGTIVFTFTRIDTEVHLSGLTIASTPEPTPSPTPAPSSSPTAAPTVAPTLAPTPTPTSLLCRALAGRPAREFHQCSQMCARSCRSAGSDVRTTRYVAAMALEITSDDADFAYDGAAWAATTPTTFASGNRVIIYLES